MNTVCCSHWEKHLFFSHNNSTKLTFNNSKGMTISLDMEMGGEQNLFLPWPCFPLAMGKVMWIQAGEWVPPVPSNFVKLLKKYLQHKNCFERKGLLSYLVAREMIRSWDMSLNHQQQCWVENETCLLLEFMGCFIHQVGARKLWVVLKGFTWATDKGGTRRWKGTSSG